MANNLNQCLFTGRIGKIEERYTSDNKLIVNFTMAIGSYKKNGDNYENVTDWANLRAFGKIAEKVRDKGKGAFIRVTTRYKTDKWQDQQGNNKTAIYFIVDDFEALTFDKSSNQSEQQSKPQTSAQQNEFIDDEIPF
ncbi:MAG: single-stranded DNA-binding protein [Gilliamella sp.]|uniref:single-stranded DNA-binding protein n=1 Tax=Gilliamella sp. TaxID=1891236 RepID=UPI0025F82C1E|nr:single-stranded DNA-binding protein [Gilliamella sp.]MCO6539890.1 single-stranded DNA-binding protein [Gilliamella sp.]